MKTIGYLDVSLESDNAGDSVISQSIQRNFLNDIDNVNIVAVPTHTRPTRAQLKALGNTDIVILGGSNILSSQLENHHQWRLWPDLMLAIRNNTVFCGVGWNEYAGSISKASKHAITWMSKPGFTHSVRDEYTRKMLATAGVGSTNTGCPTMWSIKTTKKHTQENRAIITVTDYRQDHQLDRNWIEQVKAIFDEVALVPMGWSDANYARSLDIRDIEILPYGIESLNESLSPNTVHVGTRLHAGIRAHQVGQPSLILSVDNRAKEISADTGLPVVPRESNIDIKESLEYLGRNRIEMPHDAVAAWKQGIVTFLEDNA